MKLALIGTTYPFRGGIAAFNEDVLTQSILLIGLELEIKLKMKIMIV